MKALFLERLIFWRNKNQIDFSRIILKQKIKNQYLIIKQKQEAKSYREALNKADSTKDLILVEARAAKEYWNIYKKYLVGKSGWNGRKSHSDDPLNKLLNIGYHHLFKKLEKMCQEIELPTELGFFHKAQRNKTNPFVYDFVEWLRPFVVDRVVLIFFRKKKKFIETVSNRDIALIVNKIKKVFETKFYHRKLSYCVTLEYWVKLLLFDFMRSVNNNTKYRPIFPSLRHESRCKN